MIADIVLSRPETLVTLLVAAAVLVPIAVLLARRASWSRGRTAAAVLSALGTALVVATTLGRYDSHSSWSWQVHCLVQPGLGTGSAEARLNLLLFAPACFFGVLALRRYLPVLGAAVLLSATVEVVQSMTGMGICQTSDVVRNVAGGALAGLVALALVRGRGVSRRRSG
nr:VanZ family protein [Nocardioides panaciterrulae]